MQINTMGLFLIIVTKISNIEVLYQDIIILSLLFKIILELNYLTCTKQDKLKLYTDLLLNLYKKCY